MDYIDRENMVELFRNLRFNEEYIERCRKEAGGFSLDDIRTYTIPLKEEISNGINERRDSWIL